MARRAVPLPISLQRRAFTVPEAREAGVTPARLRQHQLERPFHGVRHSVDPQSADRYTSTLVRDQARKYLPLLRSGEAFSHSTALLLLGTPIRPESRLVHVTIPSGSNPARGRGVLGHRCAKPIEVVWSAGGLPCVPFTMALEQAASALPFRELVVALDAFLQQAAVQAFGAVKYEEALALAESMRSWSLLVRCRGSTRLRAAVQLARVGAESRMETVLRLELIAVGVEDIELQADICDGDGNWIGRFDLADRARKRLVEYDGDQHRTDRTQYLKDQDRLGRAWAAGYQVLRLGKEDLAVNRRTQTRRQLCEFLGRKPQRIPAQLRAFLEEH